MPPFGKVSKQFLYKYQYQCMLIFLVIWLGTIQVKYNNFDTDIGIQMMYKKANRKIDILFLQFTLLTLYPYMPSEQFR